MDVEYVLIVHIKLKCNEIFSPVDQRSIIRGGDLFTFTLHFLKETYSLWSSRRHYTQTHFAYYMHERKRKRHKSSKTSNELKRKAFLCKYYDCSHLFFPSLLCWFFPSFFFFYFHSMWAAILSHKNIQITHEWTEMRKRKIFSLRVELQCRRKQKENVYIYPFHANFFCFNLFMIFFSFSFSRCECLLLHKIERNLQILILHSRIIKWERRQRAL